MADPTPPPAAHHPNPKAMAKGLAGHLKGKPAWMYIAGITVIIGLAFFIRRREALANSTSDGTDPNVVDNTTGAVGDQSLFPSQSQGAFGGSSDPGVQADGTDSAQDNAANPEQPTFIINIPGPMAADNPITPASSSDIATGGKAAPRVTSQHAQPTASPVAKALAVIHTIQAGSPAHSATATQITAQAKAAAAPNVFTQDNGSRSGLNYQLVRKNGDWFRFYESKPGKGDWGKGGKIPR